VRRLPRAVAQDTRHRQFGVVIQDRRRYAAKEGAHRHVSGAKCLRRLRRVDLHQAGIAVRQVQREGVDLPFHPADHRQSLAEIRLRVPGVMPQRHEHLALTLPQYVVLDVRQPAVIAVLVTQTLDNPLRRMPVLCRPALIRFQDAVDDPHECTQLRARGRMAVLVTRQNRERQHLRYHPRVVPETPPRLTTSDPIDPHRLPDPTIQLHQVHTPALCDQRKEPDANRFLHRPIRKPTTLQSGSLSPAHTPRTEILRQPRRKLVSSLQTAHAPLRALRQHHRRPAPPCGPPRPSAAHPGPAPRGLPDLSRPLPWVRYFIDSWRHSACAPPHARG